MILGYRLRELRKENKMSQEQLAEKLGVSRQSVSLWETGKTQPTLEIVAELAEIEPRYNEYRENFAEAFEEASSNYEAMFEDVCHLK